MIRIDKLRAECQGIYLEEFSLEVANGEVFFLLDKDDACRRLLFDWMRGFALPPSMVGGALRLDGAVFVDRVEDPSYFETGATLQAWFDFTCAAWALDRERVWHALFSWGFDEKLLKKRVRETRPEVLKTVYLALVLAGAARDVVVNDFAKSANREFGLFFDRLLDQWRTEQRAVLYLSDDLFHALKVADRVGFVKHGQLMPADPIPAQDLKEMNIKELYDKYLS